MPYHCTYWTPALNSNGKQTQRGIRGIFIGFVDNQKGYLVYSPASRQIYVSGDVTFDETFSSTIATTWRPHRDHLALRPVTSHLPTISTTLEHTGAVPDNLPPPPNAAVEEGDITTAPDTNDDTAPDTNDDKFTCSGTSRR